MSKMDTAFSTSTTSMFYSIFNTFVKYYSALVRRGTTSMTNSSIDQLISSRCLITLKKLRFQNCIQNKKKISKSHKLSPTFANLQSFFSVQSSFWSSVYLSVKLKNSHYSKMLEHGQAGRDSQTESPKGDEQKP